MKRLAFFLGLLLYTAGEDIDYEGRKTAPSCTNKVKTENVCTQDGMTSDELKPVENTRIDWGEVKARSFTARWDYVPNARCYTVEILIGYTIRIKCLEPCHEETDIEVKNLQPSAVWGVRVTAVGADGKCSKPGVPARTRTKYAPYVLRPTKPSKTVTPEPKECGKGYFTCHSNKSECVPNEQWCNRQLNCEDGSDERACPGSCKELDLDFRNGNYSCSRWSSPGSTCVFDCDDDYIRDGSWYTRCKNKWTHPIPTCRLKIPQSVKVLSSTYASLTVEWEAVPGAVKYKIIATMQLEKKDKREPVKRVVTLDAEECCKAEIDELPSKSDFEIIVRAVDEEGVDGIDSLAVYSSTARPAKGKGGKRKKGKAE